MSSNPKIVVFKLREVVYTLLLAFSRRAAHPLPCPDVFGKVRRAGKHRADGERADTGNRHGAEHF